MKMLVLALSLLGLTACQPVLSKLTAAPKGGQTIAVPAAALTAPTIRVQIPSRGADAILTRAAVNGDVSTWFAVDNISVSFRQGVLVASRGLGFDLMGADATGTLEALDGMGPPDYRRQMRYLTGEHKSTYLMAGCTMENKGQQTIGGITMTRFEETCKARQWTFSNQFWKDASGRIVRSRQWLSPEVGYLAVILRN